jgi:hypothetical protein
MNAENLDDSAIFSTWAKCLNQYNELQEMLKERELLFYNKQRQQQINKKLNEGFKIKLSTSHSFKHEQNANYMKEDTDDNKDDLGNVEEFSSPNSSNRQNSNLMSPEQHRELERELNKIGDRFGMQESVSKEEDSENPSRTEELEDQADVDLRWTLLSKEESKNDEIILNEAWKVDSKNENDSKLLSSSLEEPSLILLKSRSEMMMNKTIIQEIEDDAYNTHIDEYKRSEEINSWNPKKKEFYDGLDRLVDYHVREIIDDVFQEKELQEIFQNDEKDNSEAIWKNRFLEYTTKVIRLVKPNQRMMKDSMDINDYVEIKLIDNEDDKKWRYINGWVLKNNIADRRMKSEINNPRILLIGNSIGFTQEDPGIDLETYVRQENHYIDILMDRIELVKPNVIIIEKDISRSVLTKIRELNITVITNVKRKEMEKIARCTETLIMPSVNLLEKHINLGSWKLFYQKLGNVKMLKDNSKIMSTTQSLIFFDGCKPWYGSTIWLFGPNRRYLTTIKKYIQKVLKYCRDIILEKEYLFLSDGDSKDKAKSPYLLPKIGIGKSSLKYVLVSICQGTKEDTHNSQNGDENEDDTSKKEDENIYGDNEAQIKKNMHHIWGKPEKKSIEFYSENDMTLGQFLRKMHTQTFEKWEHWKEKMHRHVTDIYHGEGYVEISISIKEQSRYAQARQDEKDYDQKFKNRENNANWIKDILNHEATESITMYEEWKRWRSLTVEKKNLNSEIQEYSFTKFLEQYFYNPQIVVQNTDEMLQEPLNEEDSSSSSNSSSSSGNDCEHKIHRDLIRTFVIDGTKIKIRFRTIDSYSIDIVKFRDIDNSAYYKKIAAEEFKIIDDNFAYSIKELDWEYIRVKSMLEKIISALDLEFCYAESFEDVYNLLSNVEKDLKDFEMDGFQEIDRFRNKENHKNDVFSLIMLRRKLFIQIFNFTWMLYKSKRLLKRIWDAQTRSLSKENRNMLKKNLKKENKVEHSSSLSKNRENTEDSTRINIEIVNRHKSVSESINQIVPIHLHNKKSSDDQAVEAPSINWDLELSKWNSNQ